MQVRCVLALTSTIHCTQTQPKDANRAHYCRHALACAGSIGFTRRAGATRLTHASLSDLLARFPSAVPRCSLHTVEPLQHLHSLPLPSDGPPVAIVLGREESGLTEVELRLCSHACAIPTGRIQGSMNLSHAAAVVLCEVRRPCCCDAALRILQRVVAGCMFPALRIRWECVAGAQCVYLGVMPSLPQSDLPDR